MIKNIGDFKIGDRVIFFKEDKGLDSVDNPVWGGKFGHIVGTVDDIDYFFDLKHPIEVEWDNGTRNSYNYSNLKLYEENAMVGKKIDIKIYGAKDHMLEAVGRCLGLINDEECATLLKREGEPKKLFTSRTVMLEELSKVDTPAEIKGKRLVFAVDKINDKAVVGRKLLITERLDFIDLLGGNVMSLKTLKGNFISLTNRGVAV